MPKAPNNAPIAARRITKTLLGISVGVFLAAGTIVFMLHRKVAAIEAVADVKAAEVGSDQQIASRFTATSEEFRATTARIQYLETSVTQQSFVPTLLKQLQVLAATTHLSVDAVRPSIAVTPMLISGQVRPDGSSQASAPVGPPKKTPLPYDTIDIAIDATGSYAHTVAFLYGLTRFPKILSVTSAQLAPGAATATAGPGGSPNIVSHLHLTAYVFHDDAAPAIVPPAPGTAAAGGPIVPASAPPTVAGAAGRATTGAINASKASNAKTNDALATMQGATTQ